MRFHGKLGPVASGSRPRAAPARARSRPSGGVAHDLAGPLRRAPRAPRCGASASGTPSVHSMSSAMPSKPLALGLEVGERADARAGRRRGRRASARTTPRRRRPASCARREELAEQLRVDGRPGDAGVVLGRLEVERLARRGAAMSSTDSARDRRRPAVGLEAGHVVVDVDPGAQPLERGRIDVTRGRPGTATSAPAASAATTTTAAAMRLVMRIEDPWSRRTTHRAARDRRT